MGLDKFGRAELTSRHSKMSAAVRMPFSFTSSGNIDTEGLKICNVKNPTEKTDVSNKGYVDEKFERLQNDILEPWIFDIKKNINALIMETNDISEKVIKQKIQLDSLDMLKRELKNLREEFAKLNSDTVQEFKRLYDELAKQLEAYKNSFKSEVVIYVDDVILDAERKITTNIENFKKSFSNTTNMKFSELEQKLKHEQINIVRIRGVQTFHTTQFTELDNKINSLKQSFSSQSAK